MDLALKEMVWERDQPISHVYFPLNGVVSLVATMSDGSAVEVGTVGNEGFVGVPVFLGTNRAPVRAFSQVPGAALRMPADDLRAEADRNKPLRDLLQRYTQAFFGMLSQAVACNRVHLAGQRMALWILMVHDRVGTDVFPLTQEFLAEMVGVRRATVVEEAGKLQAAGIIEFRRGVVTVRDKRALEAAACECYAVIRGEYDRLLSRD